MAQEPVAYFITFTTYGTWLRGRAPGWVDRKHNQYGAPILAPDPRLEAAQRAALRQPVYRLDEAHRQVVLATILEVAARRTWPLWAAHVRTNHVHVILTARRTKPEKVMSDIKAWASRRLREAFAEDPQRNRWTQHGSTRYLWNEAALAEKVQYVVLGQGAPMAVFDHRRPRNLASETSPEAESAQYEAGEQEQPTPPTRQEGGR
jgi:REP element-mobilizing transposase RayT